MNFAGANNTFKGGSFDAFAAKISADGTTAWATYLGGSKEEYAREFPSIRRASAYVAGQTNSTNFAGRLNAFKGGSFDAFAAKISAAGTIAWATYLGGSPRRLRLWHCLGHRRERLRVGQYFLHEFRRRELMPSTADPTTPS